MRAVNDAFRERCLARFKQKNLERGGIDLDDLISDLTALGQMLRENGDRVDTAWPVSVVAMARIAQEAKARVDYERLKA